MEQAWQQVLAIWPHAETAIPELVQQTLAHLAWELGAKLATAHALIAAIDHGDWATAAVKLEATTWAHHHWERAARLVGWLKAMPKEAA